MMRGFYVKNITYFIYPVILLLFTVLICWFATGFAPVTPVQIVLLGCMLFIGLGGLLYGLLVSLGMSLIVLFLFGTILMWRVFISAAQILNTWDILIWMMVFPTAAVITGIFHKWITGVLAENQEMKAKFDSLVTIDEPTGFEIHKRFLLHLEEEFKRAQRTGLPFSLLLIKIKYFDQFQALYGLKETNHLLGSISEILLHNLRITDRKFRISDDTFAIILTNTVEENTDIVIGKMERLLRYHQLERKKKEITLTIAFGVSNYNEELHDFTELIQSAEHDLEQYVQ